MLWSGFYKKTIQERQNQLKLVYPHISHDIELGQDIADNMIENCIGTLGLPLGLGLNFVLNGKELVVPMAIEEPSVIAAVSGAAKTIAGWGGFSANASNNILFGQIQLLDIEDNQIENISTSVLSFHVDSN